MRTQQEIVDHYQKEQDSDFFGFTFEVLAPYLTAEQVRPFCKADADLSGWETRPLNRDAVLTEMRDYMEFAWEKAIRERGISASRSVEKMKAWLWLLGDDEMCAFAADDANFPMYGKPVLTAICRKYGFPIPTD